MRTLSLLMLVCLCLLPRSSRAASPVDVQLHGLWARGDDCESADVYSYYSKGLYLHIDKERATLNQFVTSYAMDNYIVQTAPSLQQPKQYTALIISVDGDHYTQYERVFSGADTTESLVDGLKTLLSVSGIDYFKSSGKWRIQRFTRCNDIPYDISFIHAEGIAFMSAINEVADKCESLPQECVQYVFSMIDISKDNELSKAELSRLFRILAYFTAVSKQGGAEIGSMTGALGIVSIISPAIAGSIISGSDYDSDGQLSLDEIFYDRNIASARRVFEKFSFDSAASFITGMFGSVSGLLKLF